MKPLEPPDRDHLHAAEGWLDLGDHLEANEELERITPQLRVHPDVLQVRWQIFARAQEWDACRSVVLWSLRSQCLNGSPQLLLSVTQHSPAA